MNAEQPNKAAASLGRYIVDFQSVQTDEQITVRMVKAGNGDDAEFNARKLLSGAVDWTCTGIDRMSSI